MRRIRLSAESVAARTPRLDGRYASNAIGYIGRGPRNPNGHAGHGKPLVNRAFPASPDGMVESGRQQCGTEDSHEATVLTLP